VHALIMESFEVGPPVCEVAVPKPGPNEALVRVKAGSINPVDVAVTFGALKEMYEHALPITLGPDFAGLVYLVQPPADFASRAEFVAPGGRVATTVCAANVDALAASAITATNIPVAADPALIDRLGELAVSGVLTPRIERTYTLDDVPDGFGDIVSGHARGKLAVTIAARA
jgi:NADPH:quinone reductase-like Zn-dependent oxidoreductase